MTDDVKKAETAVEAKEELASEPGPAVDAVKEINATAAPTEAPTEAAKPADPAPALVKAPVEMIKQFQPEHPAMQAMQAIDGYLAKVIPQGVHPAQATTYVLSAALSLLRTIGFTGKDVNDLVIHFNQTWRLVHETEGQKPN